MQDDGSISLAGRIAIVTGASRGIGAAIARRIAASGATVICAARSIDAAASTTPGTVGETVKIITDDGGIAHAMRCDVEDGASRQELIDGVLAQFGRIDILINNAGTSVLQSVQDMELDVVRAQTEQYLFGPLDLTLRAARSMREQGEGWIVNLGSASAVPPDLPALLQTQAGRTLAAYGAIKAAVHRLSEGLALGLHADNIAVNVVAPVGAIDTPGIRAQGIVTPQVEPLLEKVEHIAEAALSLVSLPPRERTGALAWSYKWLDEIERTTRTLDGRGIVEARGNGI